jgi:nitroreductase
VDGGWGRIEPGLAAGFIGEAARGECSFCYGQTLNLGEAISDESPMSAFLLFAPSFLKQEQAKLELPTKNVFLYGAYPLHPGEVSLVERIGLEESWHLPGFDLYDVRRMTYAGKTCPWRHSRDAGSGPSRCRRRSTQLHASRSFQAAPPRTGNFSAGFTFGRLKVARHDATRLQSIPTPSETGGADNPPRRAFRGGECSEVTPPMKRTLAPLFTLVLTLFASAALLAQDLALPAPQKTGGLPLMEALARRASEKDYDATRELSTQQLANLLWAGFGVNRPDGRRTAPSASNLQDVEIYVLMKPGAYVYDAANHKLRLVVAQDLRALGGKPDAPVTLIYVADLSKRTSGTAESKQNIASINSGFISENVYLYCASEGLATVYRGGYDRPALTEKLKLRADQGLVASQPVGYPKP